MSRPQGPFDVAGLAPALLPANLRWSVASGVRPGVASGARDWPHLPKGGYQRRVDRDNDSPGEERM